MSECPRCDKGMLWTNEGRKILCHVCGGSSQFPAPTPPAIGGDRAAEALTEFHGLKDRYAELMAYAGLGESVVDFDLIEAALASLKPADAKPGITREALEALQFYGDKDTYVKTWWKEENCWWAPIDDDGGERARFVPALETMDGGEEG